MWMSDGVWQDQYIINILYNIIVLESSVSFCIIYNHAIMTVTCDGCVTVICNILLYTNYYKINYLFVIFEL